MADIGTLRAFIEADNSQFNSAVSKSTRVISGFAEDVSKKLTSAGNSVASFGKTFSVAVTLPILAAGAAMLKTSSDAAETANKFGVVFSQVSGQADSAAKDLSKSFGLASTESKKLLSDTADLLSGFGFTQQAALDLSIETQKLAGDLASFTNIEGGTTRASEALTKALLGEREMAKALGIAILEADVQAQVFENTQEGMTFATDRQAKAFATLQIATRQSKNAIGDFERSSQELANQSRMTLAVLKDTAIELGNNLLPIGQLVVRWVRELATRFQGLTPQVQRFLIVGAAVLATIGPLAFIFGKLLVVAGFIVGAFGTLVSVFGFVAIAINSFLIPVGLAALAVWKLWNAFGGADAVRTHMTTFLNFMTENTDTAVKFIAESWLGLQVVWQLLVQGLKFTGRVIAETFRQVLIPFRDISNALGLEMGESLTNATKALSEFGVGLKISQKENAEAVDALLASWSSAPQILAQDVALLKDTLGSIPESMLTGLQETFPEFTEQIKTLIGNVQNFIATGEIPGIKIPITPTMDAGSTDMAGEMQGPSLSMEVIESFRAGFAALSITRDEFFAGLTAGTTGFVKTFSDGMASVIATGASFKDTMTKIFQQLAQKIISFGIKQFLALVGLKTKEVAVKKVLSKVGAADQIATETGLTTASVGLAQVRVAASSAAAAPNPFLIPLFVGIGLAALAAATGGFGGGGSSGGSTAAPSDSQPTASASVVEPEDSEASTGQPEQVVQITDEQGANLMSMIVRQTRNGRGDGTGTLVIEDA